MPRMKMNDHQKELFWVIVALSVPALVMGNAVYQTYFTNIEHDIVFKVFEAECLVFKTGSKTQVLTWGSGNYYFIGNWTRQFNVGESYNVTYVHQPGPTRSHQNLIVVAWEET